MTNLYGSHIFSSSLEINVLAITRTGLKLSDPDPYTELCNNDKLIVQRMLPLGTVLQKTGAASMIVESVVN